LITLFNVSTNPIQLEFQFTETKTEQFKFII